MGGAQDGDVDAVAQTLAPLSFPRLCPHVGHQGADLTQHVVGQIVADAFVGEIDDRLGQGQGTNQILTPALDQSGQTAIQLLQRLTALSGGFGIDQIGDGLGPGQIELVIEKGPAGKLARFRRAQTQFQQGLGQGSGDGASAMQMQFHHLFTGEAVGGGEIQRQTVVDILAAMAHPHPGRQTGLGPLAGQTVQGIGTGRTRQPENGNAPTSGGAGQSKDGGDRHFWSGVNINRVTRPPPNRWVSMISSISSRLLKPYQMPSG